MINHQPSHNLSSTISSLISLISFSLLYSEAQCFLLGEMFISKLEYHDHENEENEESKSYKKDKISEEPHFIQKTKREKEKK